MQNFYLSKGEALDTTQNWRENSEHDWVANLHDLIKKRPFGDHKFYVFMFVKRVNDYSGIKKMYMQPRLTKPEPLPGTTLLQVDPNDPGTAKMIWTLPNENNFLMYDKGKMFADEFVHGCIQKYLHNPRALMQREEGELSENEIREIYKAKAKGNSTAKKRKFSAVREGKV
jgi:hypothetical protein